MYQLTSTTSRKQCIVVLRKTQHPYSHWTVASVIQQIKHLYRSAKCLLSISYASHSIFLQCRSVSIRQHGSLLAKPSKLLESERTSLNFFMPKTEAPSWINSLSFKLLCESPTFSCVSLKKWQHSYILQCLTPEYCSVKLVLYEPLRIA